MTKRRRLRRAHKEGGVPRRTARLILEVSDKVGLGDALAFALVEQESDFRHIFGHDPGGPFPGEKVTGSKYRRLQGHVRAGGTSNGVGLTQVTYPGFILAEDNLYLKRANLRFGFSILAGHIHTYAGDTRRALAVYNGGAGNPQYPYADEVLARVTRWRHILGG